MFLRDHPAAVPGGAAAAMLLLAVLRLPYSYYVLLRVVTFAAAVYVAFLAHSFGKMTWVWVLGVVALLFNPIFPVHLSREVWRPLDVAVAALFVCGVFVIRRQEGER